MGHVGGLDGRVQQRGHVCCGTKCSLSNEVYMVASAWGAGEKRPAEPAGGGGVSTLEKMKRDVSQLRTYLELLDQYSLHHFIIFKVGACMARAGRVGRSVGGGPREAGW